MMADVENAQKDDDAPCSGRTLCSDLCIDSLTIASTHSKALTIKIKCDFKMNTGRETLSDSMCAFAANVNWLKSK